MKVPIVPAGNRTKVVATGTPRKAGGVSVKLRARNSAGAATKKFTVRVARR